MQNNIERQKMTRIRLNQEYRNKIANRMRVHLEQEDTQEKQKHNICKTSLKMLILLRKIVVFIFTIKAKLKVGIMTTILLWKKNPLKNILTLD
jgi:hypothetical protein